MHNLDFLKDNEMEWGKGGTQGVEGRKQKDSSCTLCTLMKIPYLNPSIIQLNVNKVHFKECMLLLCFLYKMML